ncbi:hypothetical protein KL86CLO1_11627 [uncultured Eubacteriales bacterium]|uniref:Uncharacterized protein n=1 Tax=uncultured Eubacteriales bacterium TaxID=172733 RepID=A0A212JS97_9FIRM|nr:hypothetical protein KL86CLO1_11627 [uncultured Eubacteriales bacterium]
MYHCVSNVNLNNMRNPVNLL